MYLLCALPTYLALVCLGLVVVGVVVLLCRLADELVILDFKPPDIYSLDCGVWPFPTPTRVAIPYPHHTLYATVVC